MSAKLKIANIERAFAKLQQFAATSNPTEIERAGIIQAFEFCFELCWKLFQKISELEGDVIGEPKPAIKAAFKRRLLGSESNWINMLNDRNQTVHTYNEEVAQEIYTRITAFYIDEFNICLNAIKSYPLS